VGEHGVPEPLSPPSRAAVLDAADALIERARALRGLEHHGLQLLATQRWRTAGRPPPRRLLAQERVVGAISLAAPVLLKRIRAAYDGELLLLKGPEVAVAYPDHALRPYGDVDLLVPDSRAAQRALIEAGFEPLGDERRYVRLHHLRPLRLPGLPLLVEVHHAPKWPDGLRPPSTAELLRAGKPARCGVEGILGLPAAHHAVVLAAHAWADAPLGSLRQLLDIALVAAEAGRADCSRLAERWGASRFWEATVAALNALFGGGRRPTTLRLWARHLGSVRERTVLEKHLTSWLSPLWCLSGSEGLRQCVAAFTADVRPLPGESWRHKLMRTGLALRNASVSASHHYAAVQARGLDHDWPAARPTVGAAGTTGATGALPTRPASVAAHARR
jgi:hypothetical protein